MGNLEDQIDLLERLDELRSEAQGLLKEAVSYLEKSDDVQKDLTFWPYVANAVEQKARRICIRRHIGEETALADDKLVKAITDRLATRTSLLVLDSSVLPPGQAKGKKAAAVREHSDRDLHDVPIFAAARVMQALVSTPSFAFNRIVLLCYYRILRELYTPDYHEWTIGGARAGKDGMCTAFVTGECARAVLMFARIFEETGSLLKRVMLWQEKTDFASHGKQSPPKWQAEERRRANDALFVDIMRGRHDLAFVIEPPKKPEDIGEFVKSLPATLLRSAKQTMAAFKDVLKECQKCRTDEITFYERQVKAGRDELRYWVAHTASAHEVAIRALTDGEQRCAQLVKAFERLDQTKNPSWGSVVDELENGSKNIRRSLRPAEFYLKAVIDRQLSEPGSSARGHRRDYPELAFAAASYGAILSSRGALREPWDDPSLEAAASALQGALGSDGLFPLGRPLVTDSWGSRVNAIGSEVLRAVADVFRHTRTSFDPEIAVRMIRLFRDTRNHDSPGGGFAREHVPPPNAPAQWTTGLATIALHRICRMLDVRINRDILDQFSTRPPRGTTLDELFWSDFGVASERRPSVSHHLERMRAHLLDVRHAAALGSQVSSIVLYGPPGTGKTTIAEALAASAGVTLVEVTPSDLVIGGAEVIERKAQAVFRALAMLTDVVILFDEFDPVLRRRNPNDKILNVFEFLTPGMLPKLKELHEKASERRVAYLLATNLVGSLDEAAIRDGRFDVKIGVYPPDPVSRVGRLLSEIGRHQQLESDLLERAAEVIRLTGGGPMSILGKPGWFTYPKKAKKVQERSPLHYILKGKGSPPEKVRAEKEPGEGEPIESIDATTEWNEWRNVLDWDKRVARQTNWDGVRDELGKGGSA